MKLTDITNVVRETSVKVPTIEGEQELKFKYKPNAFTPLIEQAIKDISKAEDSTTGELIISNLIPVIAWIDLEINGKNISITMEDMKNVPLGILGSILTRISEDLDPGKPKSDASAGSF
jgi:hypothetical protein